MAKLLKNPMTPSDVLETNITNIFLGYISIGVIQLGDIRDLTSIIVALVTSLCLVYNTFFRKSKTKD